MHTYRPYEAFFDDVRYYKEIRTLQFMKFCRVSYLLLHSLYNICKIMVIKKGDGRCTTPLIM